MHIKIRKNWLKIFYEKFAHLIMLFLIWACTNFKCPIYLLLFNGKNLTLSDCYLWAISDFFPFSIKWTLWKFSCCLVLLFHFGEAFRQATLSGGLLLLFANESKTTIKVVRNKWSQTCQPWPRPTQDFSRVDQDLLKT